MIRIKDNKDYISLGTLNDSSIEIEGQNWTWKQIFNELRTSSIKGSQNSKKPSFWARFSNTRYEEGLNSWEQRFIQALNLMHLDLNDAHKEIKKLIKSLPKIQILLIEPQDIHFLLLSQTLNSWKTHKHKLENLFELLSIHSNLKHSIVRKQLKKNYKALSKTFKRYVEKTPGHMSYKLYQCSRKAELLREKLSVNTVISSKKYEEKTGESLIELILDLSHDLYRGACIFPKERQNANALIKDCLETLAISPYALSSARKWCLDWIYPKSNQEALRLFSRLWENIKRWDLNKEYSWVKELLEQLNEVSSPPILKHHPSNIEATWHYQCSSAKTRQELRHAYEELHHKLRSFPSHEDEGLNETVDWILLNATQDFLYPPLKNSLLNPTQVHPQLEDFEIAYPILNQIETSTKSTELPIIAKEMQEACQEQIDTHIKADYLTLQTQKFHKQSSITSSQLSELYTLKADLEYLIASAPQNSSLTIQGQRDLKEVSALIAKKHENLEALEEQDQKASSPQPTQDPTPELEQLWSNRTLPDADFKQSLDIIEKASIARRQFKKNHPFYHKLSRRLHSWVSELIAVFGDIFQKNSHVGNPNAKSSPENIQNLQKLTQYSKSLRSKFLTVDPEWQLVDDGLRRYLWAIYKEPVENWQTQGQQAKDWQSIQKEIDTIPKVDLHDCPLLARHIQDLKYVIASKKVESETGIKLAQEQIPIFGKLLEELENQNLISETQRDSRSQWLWHPETLIDGCVDRILQLFQSSSHISTSEAIILQLPQGPRICIEGSQNNRVLQLLEELRALQRKCTYYKNNYLEIQWHPQHSIHLYQPELLARCQEEGENLNLIRIFTKELTLKDEGYVSWNPSPQIDLVLCEDKNFFRWVVNTNKTLNELKDYLSDSKQEFLAPLREAIANWAFQELALTRISEILKAESPGGNNSKDSTLELLKSTQTRALSPKERLAYLLSTTQSQSWTIEELREAAMQLNYLEKIKPDKKIAIQKAARV